MSEQSLQDWIAGYLARLLGLSVAEIDVGVHIRHYGLDSAAAVGLWADLADLVGMDLDEDLIDQFPTVQALAQHLARLTSAPGGGE